MLPTRDETIQVIAILCIAFECIVICDTGLSVVKQHSGFSNKMECSYNPGYHRSSSVMIEFLQH